MNYTFIQNIIDFDLKLIQIILITFLTFLLAMVGSEWFEAGTRGAPDNEGRSRQ